ncbi:MULTISPECIES: hypothetical protein [unclassified Maridesulfovibrio]|uniref:hypothetical protein n=1 Tax=unclassified Maridesulfovibrio TaxID=2794999 RepID=UPI003B3CDD53
MKATITLYNNGRRKAVLGTVEGEIRPRVMEQAIEQAKAEAERLGCSKTTAGSVLVNLDGDVVWTSRWLADVKQEAA